MLEQRQIAVKPLFKVPLNEFDILQKLNLRVSCLIRRTLTLPVNPKHHAVPAMPLPRTEGFMIHG